MKKIKVLLVALTSILLVTGCSSKTKEENTNKLDNLIKIVNNNESFYMENVGNTKLSEVDYLDVNGVEFNEYAVLDLDGDKEKEIIIKVKSEVGFYMVFHADKKRNYGYIMDIRELEELKTDGYYMSSGGADYQTYNKFNFDEDVISPIIAALSNESNGLFLYNNEVSTKENVDKFIEEFNKKENVEWKKGNKVEE